MNRHIIVYILGCVLKIETALLVLPIITSAIYKEGEGIYYLTAAVLCALTGIVLSRKKPSNSVFYLKEGCIITALSWILLSFFGALPLYISGEIPLFTDAYFEVVSGFTTTGASILTDVEALSHTALLWRSFTHWIGGMGVLVFLLAVIPLSGGSNMNIMRAESPGPSVGKLVPKIRTTARLLYIIYFVLTLTELLLLMAGGMPFFDAITTSFGTAGTGGFGIKGDSITSYAPHLQWIITVFMILFGVNFNAYYLIVLKQFKKAVFMEEVRYYFAIILVSTLFIFSQILHIYKNAFTAMTHAAFQVGSIITTTGFSTADFNLWPESTKFVLVMLMFIGACAGSTGGGIKVSRIVLLLKTVGKEFNSYIHPKSIKKIYFEGKPVEHEVMRSANVYFVTFTTLFMLSVLAVSMEGHDFTTSFTAVAATINNIGPGLSKVGPAENFAFFSHFSKWVLIFDMLAGRLELAPMLLLFHPTIWKEFRRKKR